MEHEARSPARFSSLLSVEPHNQKPSAVHSAHGETKVPNLFQDLTLQLSTCNVQPQPATRFNSGLLCNLAVRYAGRAHLEP